MKYSTAKLGFCVYHSITNIHAKREQKMQIILLLEIFKNYFKTIFPVIYVQ